MKYEHKILHTVIFIFLIGFQSCTKDESNLEDVLTCGSDSLLKLERVEGKMFFMPCYESWAVRLDSSDVVSKITYAASLDIDSRYHQEGMKVELNACLYLFDLPLILPDPAPWGDLYVIKEYNITKLP